MVETISNQKILIAIQYKNYFDNVLNFLKNSPLLKEQELPILPMGPFITSSIQINNTNKNIDILINPYRVEFTKVDFKFDEIKYYESIIEELIKAKNQFDMKNIEVEFLGVVVTKTVPLDETQITELEKKYSFELDIFNREIKLNYKDDELLNYNVLINYSKESQQCNIIFDVNTRFVKNQDAWNIISLSKKIEDETSDIKKILNLY